jgi:hypothetical protein
MSCIHMRELEATYRNYAERRVLASHPTVERRVSWGKHRLGQARMAYIMRKHLQNCSECRRTFVEE